jgi:RNA polymerase subunit RPABC4/transcription elongation factor Spt4
MRSGGFLRRGRDDRHAQAGVPARLRPGPIPNPFVIDDAIPALDPADGHCGGCGTPLSAGSPSCRVCGNPAGEAQPPSQSPQAPPPSPFAGLVRACVHCGAWVYTSSVFCPVCGNSRPGSEGKLPRPE